MIPGDDRLDGLHELRLVVALKLIPGRQRGGVVDKVDEQARMQVVDLVLHRARGEADAGHVDGLPVAIPGLDPNLSNPADDPAQIGHREAALVVGEGLLGQRFDHRIHEDGQRNIRFVRVPRVVANLERTDLQGFIDLGGGEPRAVGVVHRLDEVVDEPLPFGAEKPRPIDGVGGTAEHGVPDVGDLPDGHRPEYRPIFAAR